MARDTIYRNPRAEISDFTFDESVAEVFDDMLQRSIPNYNALQHLSAELADQFVGEGGRIYDIGCSTGNTLIELHRRLHQREVELVGIDSSKPVLSKCREKLAAVNCLDDIELCFERVEDFPFRPASMVIMNYILQFVPVEKREPLLATIHEVLQPKGILLLSEKVSYADPKSSELMEELYHEFKRRNGYSTLEIEQKRQALHRVMLPITVEENERLLQRVGFSKIEVVLSGYSFVSLVAHY